MKPRTPYGKSIMHRLIDLDLTEAELIKDVNDRLQGEDYKYFDRGYLHKILTNENRRPYMICQTIEEVLTDHETQQTT